LSGRRKCPGKYVRGKCPTPQIVTVHRSTTYCRPGDTLDMDLTGSMVAGGQWALRARKFATSRARSRSWDCVCRKRRTTSPQPACTCTVDALDSPSILTFKEIRLLPVNCLVDTGVCADYKPYPLSYDETSIRSVYSLWTSRPLGGRASRMRVVYLSLRLMAFCALSVDYFWMTFSRRWRIIYIQHVLCLMLLYSSLLAAIIN